MEVIVTGISVAIGSIIGICIAFYSLKFSLKDDKDFQKTNVLSFVLYRLHFVVCSLYCYWLFNSTLFP
jgi:hypothetical protein